MKIRSIAILLVLALIPFTMAASQQENCDQSTLDAWWTCFKGDMPRRGSGDYDAPNTRERGAWGETVAQMMAGTCPTVPELLSGKASVVTIGEICILMDIHNEAHQLHGWGAVAVNLTSNSNLHLQAPHVLNDSGTGELALSMMPHAKSLVVSGAHRYANSGKASDMAHKTNTMFHTAVTEITEESIEQRFMQIHGMASSSCPGDVYITEGLRQAPSENSPARDLLNAVHDHQTSWIATTYGDDPYCKLHGSTNKQGPVVRDSGNAFIHTEISFGHRGEADWAEIMQQFSDARNL